MRIECQAHAKINWALFVRGLREDGYHELQMLTQTIELCDELTFEASDALTLVQAGLPVPGDDNLILRAARALRDLTGERRGARVTLRKKIPVRAGLGGGSADCAAALRGLSALWDLRLSEAKLLALGAGLGADVPFCLGRGLARVWGVGERLRFLPPAGAGIPLVILHPQPGLSTPSVFRAWDETERPVAPRDFPALERAVQAGELCALRELAFNALSRPASRLLPEIAEAIAALSAQNAESAAMSGSGSAVFGAFASFEAASRAAENLGDRAILTKTLPA